MQLQQMFVVPLWVGQFDSHADCKDKYINSLNEYFGNNSLVSETLDYNTAYTKSILHVDSTYSELINYIFEKSPDILTEINVDSTCTLGIDQMKAAISEKGGTIPEGYETSTILKGFYFLQTPPGSGDLSIRLDIADRSYFDLIKTKESNTLNTNHTTFPIPEGTILIMPSHLTTSITSNLSEAQRMIFSFNLKLFTQ